MKTRYKILIIGIIIISIILFFTGTINKINIEIKSFYCEQNNGGWHRLQHKCLKEVDEEPTKPVTPTPWNYEPNPETEKCIKNNLEWMDNPTKPGEKMMNLDSIVKCVK